MPATNKVYIIAEAGLNHNGSMELAHRLIDTAVESGCDCVKFQKRNVATLATGVVLDAKDERFPSLGRTYREIRERHEFTFDQYKELKAHAEEKGIDFLCTAFDVESLEFLEKLGMRAYKLASHSVTNQPLLREVAKTGKPVYMSSGMCSWDELDAAVNIFVSNKNPFTLFHCVSIYPTPVDDCNVRAVETLRSRYKVPIGFSGHEFGYLPTLAAVSLGAVAVERHITTDKKLEGFDHKISLEPQELAAMVRDIRIVERALGTGQKELMEREMLTRRKYHVSIVTAKDIPAGTRIDAQMVTYKNPGTGIPYKETPKVIGKKAAQHIPADTLLEWSMLE